MNKLSLEQQIALKVTQLHARRAILQQDWHCWQAEAQQRLSSPKTLGIAFLSGFILTLSSKAKSGHGSSVFTKLIEIGSVMAIKKFVKQQKHDLF